MDGTRLADSPRLTPPTPIPSATLDVRRASHRAPGITVLAVGLLAACGGATPQGGQAAGTPAAAREASHAGDANDGGAGPATPPTLTGEALTGEITPVAPPSLCPTVGPYALTGSASGTADGPYPGTWTGQVAVTASSAPGCTVYVQFTILSPGTGSTIRGSKSFSSLGCDCGYPVSDPSAWSFFVINDNPGTYQATIRSASGTFVDRGTLATDPFAYVAFNAPVADPAAVGIHPSDVETFASSLASPIPCKPGNGYGDDNHCHTGPAGHDE